MQHPMQWETDDDDPVAAATTARRILAVLTERQYLRPHLPIREALMRIALDLRVRPAVMDEALRWLQLDSQRSIGRLQRTELAQLACSIDRLRRLGRIRPCAC